MKKYTLMILFSFLFMSTSFGQEKIKFLKGVQTFENRLSSEFKNPESILFVFKVVGCQANFYNDLTKHLKRRFRKSKIKTMFNYDIDTFIEAEKIPKKVHSTDEAELICYVEISDLKSWDNNMSIHKRKQNYLIHLLLKKTISKIKRPI
ncbi:hypothetical protein [Psychroflexus sp. S27]|uniref:hypothetical protein n=1 Tax=Psychroflexus sp. S27 TaxID=1982757 RepID=UPI00128FFD2C|nr:hypothetical protein [Psychroflexus sp. S27]